MNESKSIQKSVRLTPMVYKVIENYRGDGFNEKLANLVLDFDGRRDELKADWDRLQAGINDKRDELRRIQKQVRQLRDLEPTLKLRLQQLADLLDFGEGRVVD